MMKAQGISAKLQTGADPGLRSHVGLPSGGDQPEGFALMHTRPLINLFSLHKPGDTMPLAIHLTAFLNRRGQSIGRGLAARDTKTCSTPSSATCYRVVQKQKQKQSS